MARTFGDPNARETLTHMAQAWLRLAGKPNDWRLPTASETDATRNPAATATQPKKDKSD
jgi:hypothetical protein